MPPILHIMRHGQGFHSPEVTKDGHLIRDPHLTEKGKDQCRQRCKVFARHDKIELLLASPLRRALQTCQLSFAPCLERGLVIVAVPHAEEVSTTPSDTGSAREILAKEFDAVDFHLLKGDWFSREGEFTSDAKAVNERAKKLRKWIKQRPEKEVALVSHGFFNHFLTGEVNDRGEQTTPWWNEAELRTYKFLEEEDEQASLHETLESLSGRGKDAEVSSMKLNEPSLRGKEAPDHSGQ